jgi:dTDP-L-rhamnose 4-epimerase
MKQKILVTGGAGFIGSYIVDELVNKGHEVIIFDNLEPQVHGKEQKIPGYVNKQAEFIKGDIRNREDVKKALQDVEVIMHNAAVVGVGQSMYQIEKYVDVNTRGTALLLDVLANDKHNVKKLIVASSMSIYGEGTYKCESCGVVYPKLRTEEQLKKHEWQMKCPKCGKGVVAVPTDEDKPLTSTSIYAISKKDQEEMCLVTGKAYGIPTVALRYFNTYGPRQSLNNPYTGVAAIFSSRIKNNNPPLIYEDGLQKRDFIHVNDIVQGNIIALENSNADYKALNVGTGKASSVLDVANVLSKLYKKDLKPIIVNKFRAGDVRDGYADISKIKELGFEPSISLEEGMKDLVAWGETVNAVDKVEAAQEELKEKGLVE